MGRVKGPAPPTGVKKEAPAARAAETRLKREREEAEPAQPAPVKPEFGPAAVKLEEELPPLAGKHAALFASVVDEPPKAEAAEPATAVKSEALAASVLQLDCDYMPLLTEHQSLWRTGLPEGGCAALEGTWHVYAAVLDNPGQVFEPDDASVTGRILSPCVGTLTLDNKLCGTLSSLGYVGAESVSPDNTQFAGAAVQSFTAEESEEVTKRHDCWKQFPGAFMAGGLQANVMVDALTRASSECLTFDEDTPCLGLIECCAVETKVLALASDEVDLRTVDVHAASDASAVATARAAWDEMSPAEQEAAMEAFEKADEDGSEVPVRPDFFDVLDSSKPPFVILPGDLRLSVRWEDYGGMCAPGYGIAYFCRRACPPAVHMPVGPPQSFLGHEKYLNRWRGMGPPDEEE